MVHPPVFLEQYYSRLIGPERRARLTAETYRYETRRFLAWLAETAGTLETAGIRDLSRYLEQRRTQDRIGSGSISKACAVLSSESVARLLGMVDTGSPTGVRNRRQYELLYAETAGISG